MTSAYSLLKDAFRLRAYTPRTADMIADMLYRRHPRDYTQPERLLMLSLLKSCILADANHSRIECAERDYPRTLRNIFNLQAEDRFSKRVSRWMDESMDHLVRQLQNDVLFRIDLNHWANLSFPERFTLLEHVHKKHIAISGSSFNTVPLRLISNPAVSKTTVGRAFTGLDGQPERIEIHAKLIAMNDPVEALETVHHETVHILLGQLAKAWKDNDISLWNRLGPDARLAYRRAVYNVYCPAEIPPGYRNDSEEMIATKQGRVFVSRMAPLLPKPLEILSPAA